MAETKTSQINLKTLVVYAIICCGVIVVVLLMDNFELFTKAELSTQDMRFRIRGVESHADDIVIVGIDPQSLEMLNLINMPPRDFHAKLTENLYKAGAKAVLFDFLFLTYTGETSTDGYSLSSGEELGGKPSREDSLLAAALKNYPRTVIARKQKVLEGKSTQQSVGESPYPPELFRNRDQLAFVDMYQDGDSFIRRARLIANDMEDSLGCNYSFALKAAMVVMDADTAWVDTEKHLGYVGDRIIPLDDDNFMIINYPMDEITFQETDGYISYEQVLDDSEWGIGILIEKERLKDKVVLVGAAWPESGDIKATPFYLGTTLFSKNEYPMYGVHVHKSIASTILLDRFIKPSNYSLFVMLVIIMTVLATLINYRFRGFLGIFLSVAIIFVYSCVTVFLFIYQKRLIPVIAPSIATVMLDYISIVTYNFLTERKQKAMIRGAFAQYVPVSVVGELLKHPEKLTLGGEERVMTVLFSDIAGFTTISEGLTPTELVVLLNEYLTLMTNIVLQYNGIIDKYEGDAIMAEFGAPLPDDNHAVNACLTALDMQVKLAELREKLEKEGRPTIRARVGLNSGSMVIGNMGSDSIFDYTVMGDNVNLGSRLEGANKVYGTYIMCSEETRRLAEHVIITRKLDLLRVKGKTEGVLVHEILARKNDGLSEQKQHVLDFYSQGLAAYKNRHWDEGIELFNKAISIDKDDMPSTVYLERCREFKENHPPEDWDGIFTMRTK
ncbi:CHASE2 domain-containing protein [Candidatus Latescibacterota bacterium]